MKKNIYSLSFSTISLIVFFFILPTVSATESHPKRVTYNSAIIGHGISFYYSYNGYLPDSLSDLIYDGWVPANLLNDYTGELITGDSVYGNPGEWKIEKKSPNELDLIYYQRTTTNVLTYDDSILGKNSFIPDLTDAKSHLIANWAYCAIDAYYNTNGYVPTSIYDLQNANFWPFENVQNVITGAPMAFDSTEFGDMNWEFDGDTVSVNMHLPIDDGDYGVLGFTYPLTIGDYPGP